MVKIINTSSFYSNKNAPIFFGSALKPFCNDKTIIICIGTDKCIGDSLGPLVGTLLKREGLPLNVFGTLVDPIHAVNLNEKLEMIFNRYPEHKIIAIDASLGSEDSIGKIQLKEGPIHPGKGVGKKLKSVGDISIIGVVDKLGNNNKSKLHNIRLGFIYEIADTIVESFKYALNEG